MKFFNLKFVVLFAFLLILPQIFCAFVSNSEEEYDQRPQVSEESKVPENNMPWFKYLNKFTNRGALISYGLVLGVGMIVTALRMDPNGETQKPLENV